MQIKPASDSDVTQLSNLCNEIFSEDGFFRLIRGDNTFKLFIKAMISTAEVYIATEDNSQIIGFISLATLDEILKEYRKNLSRSDFMVILANVIKPGNFRLIFSSFLYQILDRNGIYRLEINWIGVDKKFQGQGVGSKLIKIALKEKHCFQNIYVKTLKKSVQNIEFYEQNGFIVFKRICGRVIMRRNKNDIK